MANIMKYKIISVFILFILSNSLFEQKNTELSGEYLGQKPPGTTPELFAPGVVSTEEGWEAAVTFSPDGKEFFFTRRADIQGNDNRLMYMQIKDGLWTMPKAAPFAKNLTEYESFIAPDGKTIFYNSDRPKPKGVNTKGKIWFSKKTPQGWSEGEYLTETINKGWIMFVTVAANNNLYFTAGFNNKYGLYKSELKNGEYQEPEYLMRGAHPFIAPDESYLIFDAQPEGMGKTQLYICFKDKNGDWTDAIKFDETINATNTENIPNVSPDGKYFFFHRNNDIYWVDAKIIENLRPEEIASKEEENSEENNSANNSQGVFSVMKKLFQHIYTKEIMTQE